MSSNEIAISVSNLSKCFQIYESPRDRLKQFFAPRLHKLGGKAPKQYFREFWALKDVSFEIKKGETVGIIGRNGSGKSTLLQMICGTLNPTSGSIQVNGRVAALLELGSGFSPEFTGRENVYMNAFILGLNNQEINARFNDIVTFADIGDFIDQPVKTYSSGMMVRLAFAVIAHVEADILVIDEALAVGDVFFQQKCMRYLRNLQSNGGTVIFVSHDISAVVSLCNRGILLSHNEKAKIGSTEEISKIYIENVYSERSVFNVPQDDLSTPQLLNSPSSSNNEQVILGGFQPENLIEIRAFRHDAQSFGHGGIKIIDVWFQNSDGIKVNSIFGGESVDLYIQVKSLQNIKWPTFGFMLKDRLGQYVIAEGTDLAFRDHSVKLNAGETAYIKFSFLMPILISGEYTLNVAAAQGIGDDHIQHCWINDALVLHSIKSRLVHGICGLQQLQMELKIPSNS